MVQLSVIEAGAVGAPAKRVYRYVADMRQHHQHFLLPSFGQIRVEDGGYGAGTVYGVPITLAGRTRQLHMRVDEPQPGRVISESGLDSPLVTTWTITPKGAGCRVQIATTWPSTGGLQGLIERLLAPGVMRRVYRDELARLDRYAREQAGA